MRKSIERLENRISLCERWLRCVSTMDGMEILNLLDTRDSIQYSLRHLNGACEKYSSEISKLDKMLRANAEHIKKEIAADSYPRDSRRPPRTHWWWYLDGNSVVDVASTRRRK